VVFAATVPGPLNVKPNSVMPLASVSKDDSTIEQILAVGEDCAALIVRLRGEELQSLVGQLV